MSGPFFSRALFWLFIMAFTSLQKQAKILWRSNVHLAKHRKLNLIGGTNHTKSRARTWGRSGNLLRRRWNMVVDLPWRTSQNYPWTDSVRGTRNGFADIIFINMLSELISCMAKSITVKIDAQSASSISKPKEKNVYKLYTYYTLDIDLDRHKGLPNV